MKISTDIENNTFESACYDNNTIQELFAEVEIFDTDASREHYEEDNRSWEGKIASYIEYKNNILGALEAKVSDLMDGADDKRRS